MTFKLLVLEDDANLRDTLAEVLEEQGYQVVAVARAEDAIEAAAAQPFDLIVSDIRMEGMDGLEAIEATQRQQPGIGSLVVSGWASEAETLRAIQLNVGAYLRKPFSMHDFLQQVQKQLARRAQELQRQEQQRLFRGSLLWALEGLAQMADAAGLGGDELLGRAELAWRLAQSRELPSELSELLRVAALLAPLQQLPAARLPAFASREALVLGPLQQLWQDTGTLPGRILAVALANPEERSALDPGLAEEARTLPTSERARAPLEVLQGLQDPARLDRSLLALAHALEEAGDGAHAARAYREILDRNQPSSAAVAAALRLGALALAQNQTDSGTAWILQAPVIASELGPVSAAQARLQAGLLLRRQPQGETLLRQAHAELTRLGLAGEAAQCAVLLGTDERLAAARLLLEPAQAASLAAGLGWLAPELLRLGAEHPELRAGLARLAADCAAPLARLLADCDRDVRQALLEVLQDRPVATELRSALLADPDKDLRERAQRLSDGSGRPLVRLQSMGFFQVFSGGSRVAESAFKTQKVKYLLAYLAAQGERAVAEDQLIEAFWPDTPGRGKRNLYAATSELRRCLRCPEFIVRERDTVGLSLTLPRWHDLDEMESAWSRADHRTVAGLAQGPYLDGCYLDWAVRLRGQWESRVAESLCQLAQQAAELRRYSEAQEFALRALAVEPLRQEAHLLKMRAHLGLGQPELAVRQFEQCERLLQREYAGEPTIELLTVYQRARHGLGDSAAV